MLDELLEEKILLLKKSSLASLQSRAEPTDGMKNILIKHCIRLPDVAAL